MVSGYKAAFEDRPDLSRHLEGFYVAGDPSPAFVFFKNLIGEPRDMAARIALTNLFLNCDVHWEAVDWNMVECELCYQINVVTFADARVLFNIDMLRDPILVSEAIDYIPDFAPCVIEIFGDHDEYTCIKIATRYLEMVRNMLPAHERPAPGFCNLQFRT